MFAYKFSTVPVVASTAFLWKETLPDCSHTFFSILASDVAGFHGNENAIDENVSATRQSKNASAIYFSIVCGIFVYKLFEQNTFSSNTCCIFTMHYWLKSLLIQAFPKRESGENPGQSPLL